MPRSWKRESPCGRMSNGSTGMIFTPGEEICARLDRLRPLMEEGRLDAAFFHYKIDYYYLSGTMQDAVLLVPLEREPVLFVKRELDRARRESPLENVIPLSSPRGDKALCAGDEKDRPAARRDALQHGDEVPGPAAGTGVRRRLAPGEGGEKEEVTLRDQTHGKGPRRSRRRSTPGSPRSCTKG